MKRSAKLEREVRGLRARAEAAEIKEGVAALRRWSGRWMLVATLVVSCLVMVMSALLVSRPELTKPKANYMGTAFFAYEVPREDACAVDPRSPSCGALVTSLTPSRPRPRP
jgi:hypothetical protein